MSKSLTLLGNILFGLVAVVVGGGLLALTVLPPVLRYQTYVVLSGSMEPAIRTGSVIVATAVDPKMLQVGDVITFLTPDGQENITHRIVGIHGDAQGHVSFITKGDANGVEDQNEIRFDHLAGKVTLTIPYVGYFFKFIGSPSMRMLFIVIPGLLLLGSWLWEVWKPRPKPHVPAEEVPPGMAPAAAAAPSLALSEQRKMDVGVAADAAALPIRQ
ncbi:MAG TPA: signal peptidase I [Chloroflexota bacterium]|nr:signal peptidase I [Chloroflexota bacterium]